MVRQIKLALLRTLKTAGIFDAVANTKWRSQRLLILCYHGIALEDEHLWRPRLYMPVAMFEERLKALRAMGCSVLPLAEALSRLQTDDLPSRSVAVTFDDGTYDFYRQAFPLLRSYQVPATVYQTTYYTDNQVPVFNLICSYMLWKRRGEQLPALPELGLSSALDLRTELGRHHVVRGLVDFAENRQLTGIEKNELARDLARVLGVDYNALTNKRILQLMNAVEVAEIANAGIDVQLHTHRHRTPEDEALFRREIADNRRRIESFTRRSPAHFCYPAGIYRKEFFPWLGTEGVLSATTCDAGLVNRQDNPLLLPRFVDTSRRTQAEFESWLSGLGSLIALNKVSPQQYIPAE
jgi:peptidoglycan/xylan/chitin deacetylase (PgdA/CDA1 family)